MFEQAGETGMLRQMASCLNNHHPTPPSWLPPHTNACLPGKHQPISLACCWHFIQTEGREHGGATI